MDYNDLDTEQKQLDFALSAPRVQVVDILTGCRNYTEEGKAKRKPGVKGWISAHSNSHGLCFRVEHEDGSLAAWYEWDELTIIPSKADERDEAKK